MGVLISVLNTQKIYMALAIGPILGILALMFRTEKHT
jgi:hypothetical protein